MRNTKKEPVAERSKRWIVEALLALMNKRDYGDITVLEIAGKAGLSRRSFYRHFSTKEAVLARYAESLREEYVSALRREKDLSLPTIAKVYFAFWSERRDFLCALRRGGMLHLVLALQTECLPGVYSELKGDPGEYDNREQMECALAFSAGGFWNLLSRWLDRGARESPEEMADIARAVLGRFVRSL